MLAPPDGYKCRNKLHANYTLGLRVKPNSAMHYTIVLYLSDQKIVKKFAEVVKVGETESYLFTTTSSLSVP